jgi:hypothetical protein
MASVPGATCFVGDPFDDPPRVAFPTLIFVETLAFPTLTFVETLAFPTLTFVETLAFISQPQFLETTACYNDLDHPLGYVLIVTVIIVTLLVDPFERAHAVIGNHRLHSCIGFNPDLPSLQVHVAPTDQ